MSALLLVPPPASQFISSLNNISHYHHHYCYHFVDVYIIYFLSASQNAHCCLYLTTYCNGLDSQLPQSFYHSYITILLWHLYSASFYLVEFYRQVVFSYIFCLYFFSCFCMPLLLACSVFSRMVLNPFLFYWITHPQLFYTLLYFGLIFILHFPFFVHLGWICFFLDSIISSLTLLRNILK